MDWIMGGVAIVLLVMGLIGQGFEMRKIRKSIYRDEELKTSKIFGDKRNFKWYVVIGIGLVLWFIAERTPQYSI
jgi:Na+/H+ antiporter NhaD/arsenite permease-like protein